MKKKLIIVLLLLLLAGGYVYAGYNGWLPQNFPTIPKATIDQFKTKVPAFNDLQGGTKDQLETVSSRAKELGSFAQDALGNTIQVDNSKPLQEKAVEYGQYVYCKQVVESYEINQKLRAETAN